MRISDWSSVVCSSDLRQVIDVLQAYPASWSPQALVEALRPLTPRLSSIASSQTAVGEDVHLTVAHLEYATTGGDPRWGVASHQLATSEEGAPLPTSTACNSRFRLPAHPPPPPPLT